jgi:hypothetical protein
VPLIEHEDLNLPPLDGVRVSVSVLRGAIAASPKHQPSPRP